MAKSKTFWITRDLGRSDYEMWPWNRQPKMGTLSYPTGATFEFCCDEFESLTGITLKPGEKVKARLVIGE